MALEGYPLSTGKGQILPLEVARPLRSIAIVADGSTHAAVLALGELYYIHSTKLVRVAAHNEAGVDLTYPSVANSYYVPANSTLVLEAQGTNVTVLGADITQVVYLTVIATWKAAAADLVLENA